MEKVVEVIINDIRLRQRQIKNCDNQLYIPTLMQKDKPGLRLGDARHTPCHARVVPVY